MQTTNYWLTDQPAERSKKSKWSSWTFATFVCVWKCFFFFNFCRFYNYRHSQFIHLHTSCIPVQLIHLFMNTKFFIICNFFPSKEVAYKRNRKRKEKVLWIWSKWMRVDFSMHRNSLCCHRYWCGYRLNINNVFACWSFVLWNDPKWLSMKKYFAQNYTCRWIAYTEKKTTHKISIKDWSDFGF